MPPASQLTSSPDRRMGLWQAHDAGGAAAQTSTIPREDAARAGPRAGEAGESREEADPGDQEERQGWADGRVQGAGKGSGAHEAVY